MDAVFFWCCYFLDFRSPHGGERKIKLCISATQFYPLWLALQLSDVLDPPSP